MAAHQRRFLDGESPKETQFLSLRVSDGPSCGQWSEVGIHEIIRVGRSTECTLRVFDPRMSRLHFEAFFAHDEWWLNDLGSCNGTLVNDQKICEPVKLQGGEVVLAGDTRFQVTIKLNQAIRHAPHSEPAAHDIARLDALAKKPTVQTDSGLRDYT